MMSINQGSTQGMPGPNQYMAGRLTPQAMQQGMVVLYIARRNVKADDVTVYVLQ
jgi:hypothetical protein